MDPKVQQPTDLTEVAIIEIVTQADNALNVFDTGTMSTTWAFHTVVDICIHGT